MTKRNLRPREHPSHVVLSFLFCCRNSYLLFSLQVVLSFMVSSVLWSLTHFIEVFRQHLSSQVGTRRERT